MAAPGSITAWMKGLPIVWLTGNENGQADATAQGTVYDGQVDLVKQAVEARFPDRTPVDGLPHVGNDSGLIQGYAETNDDFRARCKDRWSQWELAGTWAELLFQLYFSCGLEAGSTFVVQQNGHVFSLTSNPGPTDDPTTLLQIDNLYDNYNVTYPDPVPWWRFDDREDLCSRFGLVIASPVPGTICVTARATFTAASMATATWSGPFDGPSYSTMYSLTTTDGTVPIVTIDESSQTATTVTVNASAPFTGYVDLIGWADGGNPFAGPSQSTRNLINLMCDRWKPAKAKFMGTWVLVDGWMLGWPLGTTIGDPDLVLGDGLVAYLGP